LVALSYFRQLGHDSQHRIFKSFAWDIAKAKNGDGGYLDYPKLACTKLVRMTTAEIGRFLMVCALAGDLYCPTYISGATLTRHSILAKEAAHYRINSEKIVREARERLAKNFPRRTSQSNGQPPRKSKRKEGEG
jgi:hypothetical protein